MELYVLNKEHKETCEQTVYFDDFGAHNGFFKLC